MRQVLLAAPGAIEVREDVPVPEPGTGHLVRLMSAGLIVTVIMNFALDVTYRVARLTPGARIASRWSRAGAARA